MRLNLTYIFIFVIGICSLNTQMFAQSVEGRFVGFHRFGGFNPRDPVQQLILQTEAHDKLPNRSIIKAIFFPRTGGMVGTVETLETYHVNYSRLWTLVLRSPTEKEKQSCDFDNYMRTTNENVDSNKKGEPTMNFYSTQFDAWVVFPKFSTMRCVVIESLSDGELTIRSRKVK